MAGNASNDWRIEYNSGIPVYRQIVNLACASVAAGALKPGDQLPTIRALSDQLNVNPNTVAKAYRELELKGIVVSERGAGSFIQAPPAVQPPTARAKRAKLKNLYDRLIAEAADSGVSESELLDFIKQKGTL